MKYGSDLSIIQGHSHWYGKGGSYMTTFSVITNGKPHLFLSINRKRHVSRGVSVPLKMHQKCSH